MQARSRYKFDKRPGISPGRQCWKKALAQYRGTNYLEGRKLSWCRILIACRCAHPERSEGRVPGYVLVLVSGSDSCKKHDKQLTHIVRVRFRGNFNIVKIGGHFLL